MYCTIIPAVRSIRGKDEFVYAVPDGITIRLGQVVQIPWRKQTVLGLVWRINQPKPKFSTRQIISTTDIEFADTFLRWIAWFSKYYYVAKSVVIKQVLPDIPKRSNHASVRKSEIQSAIRFTSTTQSITVVKDRIPVIQKITHNIQKSAKATRILLYTDTSEIMAIVLGLLNQTTKRIAVIVGEEYQVHRWASALQIFQPVLIHSRLSKTALYSAWRSLLDGKARVYIGTKRLSVSPLNNIDTVIIIDPEDPSHKQWDMNPRYTTLTVIEQQIKNTPKTCVVFTQSPTLELHQRGDISAELLDNSHLSPVTIIDMRSEQFAHNQTLLAQSVLERCARAETIFLWFNKKGREHFLICRACDALEPNIRQRLCTQCGSADLIKHGFGTTGLYSMLQTKFPERTILEITKDSGSQSINYEQHPIIIGTVFAEPLLDWTQITSVIVVSVDGILSQPEFQVTEHTLQHLVHLRNTATQLCIQTYTPEHVVFRALNEHYPVWWYEQELMQRKKFLLPPVVPRLIARNVHTHEERIVHEVSEVPKSTDWIIDRND